MEEGGREGEGKGKGERGRGKGEGRKGKGEGEGGKGRETDNLKNINLLDGRNALTSYVASNLSTILDQGSLPAWGHKSKRRLEQSTNLTTFYKEG